MINGYRNHGQPVYQKQTLHANGANISFAELETFGLSDADLDTVFNAGVEVGMGPAKLRDIRDMLEQTYWWSIGANISATRIKGKMV